MADLTDSRVLHALAQFSEEPVPEWKKRFDLQFMWLLQRVCDHHFIHIVWSAVGIPLELGVEWYGPLTNLLLPVLYVNPEWPSCVRTTPPAHVLLPAVEVSMHVSTRWDPRNGPRDGHTYKLWSCMGIWNKRRINEWMIWYLHGTMLQQFERNISNMPSCTFTQVHIN